MKNYHFSAPPINEVVCGIQFDTSRFDFVIQHAFWSKIKSDFTKIVENPPLGLVFDKNSGKLPQMAANRFPNIRYFFLEQTDSRLIQLQDGRLLFNWRRIPDKNLEYPKFEYVFEGFTDSWDKLLLTYNEHKVRCIPNQFELTYIDHIPIDLLGEKDWNLGRIFNIFSNAPFSDKVDNLVVGVSTFVPELKGHVHVNLKSAIRNSDKKHLLILDTTARGFIEESELSLSGWFEIAHEKIFETFLKITTDEAKKEWGYKS